MLLYYHYYHLKFFFIIYRIYGNCPKILVCAISTLPKYVAWLQYFIKNYVQPDTAYHPQRHIQKNTFLTGPDVSFIQNKWKCVMPSLYTTLVGVSNLCSTGEILSKLSLFYWLHYTLPWSKYGKKKILTFWAILVHVR